MIISERRKKFIDRTARRPEGKWAVKNYNDPRAHYRSFRIIMDRLKLKDSDTYCEIGCGGGVLLKMAIARALRGAAVDHSADMVQLAINNNRASFDEGKLEILQGSAEKLPWKAKSFTACASANMFFFVEHPEAMLSEIFRVLKNGGRFAMVTLGKSLFSSVSFGWLYSLKLYSDREMAVMLERAGFRNVSVKSGITGMVQVCYAEK